MNLTELTRPTGTADQVHHYQQIIERTLTR